VLRDDVDQGPPLAPELFQLSKAGREDGHGQLFFGSDLEAPQPSGEVMKLHCLRALPLS
jgi:hypothetical protein